MNFFKSQNEGGNTSAARAKNGGTPGAGFFPTIGSHSATATPTTALSEHSYAIGTTGLNQSRQHQENILNHMKATMDPDIYANQQQHQQQQQPPNQRR